MTAAAADANENLRFARGGDPSQYGDPRGGYSVDPSRDPSDSPSLRSYGLPGDPDDRGLQPPPIPARSRDPGHSGRRPPIRQNHGQPGRGHDDEDSLPEAERIQHHLTARYGNPAMVRLVQSLSSAQSLQFYVEASSLIDSRHLKPSSYDARVKQAAKNLICGLDNNAFLQANGVQRDGDRTEALRRDLQRLLDSKAINGREEAYQALQWTVQAAERDLGVRPAAIAVEFVFGATESLDKYSAFVPVTKQNAPSVELEDHIVGVGVEIKPEDNGILIVHALPGSPAAEAGLQSGDIIEAINGRQLAGSSLDAAVDQLTGPAGSRVTVSVRRDSRLAEVELVRRRVEVHSVSEVKMLEQNVGYIKLEKFAQSSADEFDKALWSLHRQGMKSLIVDVRGNPGGLLTTAIELSNKFVPCGTIVSTRGRDGSDNTVERARSEQTWKVPLVVLVDENSASASEIFAAAIQENGRGLVVGRRTYGKGTVQTHFPMQSVSGNLRLTTAQFFSPKGRLMAGAGVDPDVPVAANDFGRHASYHNDSPYRHEASYRHGGQLGQEQNGRDPYETDRNGREQYGRESYGRQSHGRDSYGHNAAYRSERNFGLPSSDPSDADMRAALEAATSPTVFELANTAASCRNRQAPGFPNSN